MSSFAVLGKGATGPPGPEGPPGPQGPQGDPAPVSVGEFTLNYHNATLAPQVVNALPLTARASHGYSVSARTISWSVTGHLMAVGEGADAALIPTDIRRYKGYSPDTTDMTQAIPSNVRTIVDLEEKVLVSITDSLGSFGSANWTDDEGYHVRSIASIAPALRITQEHLAFPAWIEQATDAQGQSVMCEYTDAVLYAPNACWEAIADPFGWKATLVFSQEDSYRPILVCADAFSDGMGTAIPLASLGSLTVRVEIGTPYRVGNGHETDVTKDLLAL